MMFENGLLAEVEVDNLYELEEEIVRVHGADRKITVLNVQYCKGKDWDNLHQRNKTKSYYRVFIMVGETHQQAKLRREDRAHLNGTLKESPKQKSIDTSKGPFPDKSIDDLKKKYEDIKKKTMKYGQK